MRTEWVDFREMKSRISLAMVLTWYGVELKGNRGRCPLPSHRSKKEADSFAVDFERNVWACHSNSCAHERGGRKGGNVLDFAAAMEKCSIRDAALRLQREIGLGEPPPVPANRQVKRPEPDEQAREPATAEVAQDATSNPPLGFTLKNVDYGHPEVLKRIPREIAEKYGIGMMTGKGSMAGRIVIPISNKKGELVAYMGRAVDGSEPKYKLPAGFRKSLEVWNLSQIEGSSVCVTEGVWGALAVIQVGFAAVALLGCEASEEQLAELLKFERVTVFLDGDEPGMTASHTLVGRLVRGTFVRQVIVEGRQPDNLTKEDLRQLLE